MSAYINIPDFVERKGSLFLRSEHMNYSRATLNSNWHQARESEPKDYDINKDQQRDLCKATYDRIGNVSSSGNLPHTTYQDFSEQVYLKEDVTEMDPKPMINSETAGDVDLDRYTGTAQKGNYGAVLPTHHTEHNKCHFETTHRSDYGAPFPFTPAEEKPQEFTDYSQSYKRCHSQFADTVNHRRSGRNTWQDESGIYANSNIKAECPTYKIKDPFQAMKEMEME